MGKYDYFTSLFPVNITTTYKLIPIGRTLENIIHGGYLADDEERQLNYSTVKSIADRYHRRFIDEVLSGYRISLLPKYAGSFFAGDEETLADIERDMREEIAAEFKKTEGFKSLFNKDMLDKIRISARDDAELYAIERFKDCSGYFIRYNDKRKTLYDPHVEYVSIPHRIVNDNLPIFLSNLPIWTTISDKLGTIASVNNLCHRVSVDISSIFEVDGYNNVLTQTGIDLYNEIVQSINAAIIEFNTEVKKSEKLPMLRTLQKQILSDWMGGLNIKKGINSEEELAELLLDTWEGDVCISDVIKDTLEIFSELHLCEKKVLYLDKKWSSLIFRKLYGNECSFEDLWIKKSGISNYESAQIRFSKTNQFSLYELESLKDVNGSIEVLYNEVNLICENVKMGYDRIKEFVHSKGTSSKPINDIKMFLDSIMDLYGFLDMLVKIKARNKDVVFYSRIAEVYERVCIIRSIYARVRNYATAMPFSKEKFKLNFDNSTLANGWDSDYEKAYRTVILRKDKMVYVGILSRVAANAFSSAPYVAGEEYYEKMNYALLSGANKMLPKVMFAKKNMEKYAPSERIVEIYKNGTFKKGKNFILSDCHALIDFYKESIEKNEKWSRYNFSFRKTEDYENIGEFYNDVNDAGYSVNFVRISKNYIDELVNNGGLFLFRVYHRDMDKTDNRKKSMHTRYFDMLFDERNLADPVYRLNGGAEFFFRKSSINKSNRIIHPKGQVVENKNPLNSVSQHEFKYEIIKDRRYTEDQFFLHVPISMNTGCRKNLLDVSKNAIEKDENNYIIGIARGENHLLTACVIDEDGSIIEQKSLDVIEKRDGDYVLNTDYKTLIMTRINEEKGRRKSWSIIESVVKAKEGYLTQVINEICKLSVKYNAIIALEDYDSDDNGCIIENKIYKKLYTMLINKLSYFCVKDRLETEPGGMLRAYQLVDKNYNSRKNGILHRTNAAYTVGICPVTGFTNYIKPRYKSLKESQVFIKNIDSITYNTQDDVYEFVLDYEKLSLNYKGKWTVCTNGVRSVKQTCYSSERPWEKKFNVENINLTSSFRALFATINADESNNIKECIINCATKDFYQEFFRLLNLTMKLKNQESLDSPAYIISPVRGQNGSFYDSRKVSEFDKNRLPFDCDTNKSFHIAKKVAAEIRSIKATK